MSILIRKASVDDVSLIVDFINQLAKYEKLLHEVEVEKEDIKRDLFCDNPRVFCEIAEIDNKPVGFALWYYTYSTFRGKHGIWLEDLFVDPNVRGSGAGKALMASLAQKCSLEGLARLEWWVLDWNKSAIDFYNSIGAIMQSEWSVCRIDGIALKDLAKK
jgi:GNAT superfamily N-acetyltransferase